MLLPLALAFDPSKTRCFRSCSHTCSRCSCTWSSAHCVIRYTCNTMIIFCTIWAYCETVVWSVQYPISSYLKLSWHIMIQHTSSSTICSQVILMCVCGKKHMWAWDILQQHLENVLVVPLYKQHVRVWCFIFIDTSQHLRSSPVTASSHWGWTAVVLLCDELLNSLETEYLINTLCTSKVVCYALRIQS